MKNPAHSLCKAMGRGKERVAPGCLSPGASFRVVGVLYGGMDIAQQLLATLAISLSAELKPGWKAPDPNRKTPAEKRPQKKKEKK